MKFLKLLMMLTVICASNAFLTKDASAQADPFTQQLNYASSQQSAKWRVDAWGTCDCAGIPNERTRTVQCVDSLNNVIPDAMCVAYDKPEETRDCAASCPTGGCPPAPTCLDGTVPAVNGVDAINGCDTYELCTGLGCGLEPTCSTGAPDWQELRQVLNPVTNCMDYSCRRDWCATGDLTCAPGFTRQRLSHLIGFNGEKVDSNDGCYIYECMREETGVCPSDSLICPPDEVRLRDRRNEIVDGKVCRRYTCLDANQWEDRGDGYPRRIVSTTSCASAPACPAGETVFLKGTTAEGCDAWMCQSQTCPQAPDCTGIGTETLEITGTDVNGCNTYFCQ